MEKFKIDEEKDLELYTDFAGRVKDTFQAIIENTKENINDYEIEIELTKSDIKENEASKEKCEHEISRMEKEIDSIKATIDNVESTYKKMMDAYSSTSKGETKELYSDIINSAKENCDNEVEKNRTEIARLNSDIEAIKNNIVEFNKIVDSLNSDLEIYKTELYRYKKSLEYMLRTSEKVSLDLDEISQKKETTSKKPETRSTRRETTKAETTGSKRTTSTKKKTLNPIGFEYPEKKKEEKIEEVPKSENRDSLEDALKQIYELTGYPQKDETVENNNFSIVEEPVMENSPKFDELESLIDNEPKLDEIKPIVLEENTNGPVMETSSKDVEEKQAHEEEKPVFTDNLESLFKIDNEDIKEPEPEPISFLESEMSSWESILNANSLDTEIENINPTVESASTVEKPGTGVDELLTPYGTTYDRLKNLVGNKITYKDGREVPFEMTEDDVTKAINAVDGYDLKQMKTVGPEITLLRKVKEMKEGNL